MELLFVLEADSFTDGKLIIINDSIKFKFNKNKRDRIIKILSENRLYFPASQE